ncbi:MAG: phenylalanine--tRNA ligase subunit beta [Candidatus Falkowbacteria bacterium]
MLLSLNWLKDFIKIPKGVGPEDLASRLTMHTVEVEGWSDQSLNFKGVVIGKILEVAKHPNADRLRVTKVDIKKEILTIVCGAPNVEVGQLVPVATIGTVLQNGLEIKESEIRGEKSYGMLCAEDELGLGTSHEGILILDKKAKIGQSLAEHLGLNDIVLEIDNKSLSNRSDLWGHYGMAREISTFYDNDLKDYNSFLEPAIIPGESKLDIKVEDKKLCPRYMALAISDIKISQSPKWLKDRLVAIGLRPINNIVDVTNYVMFETGQPLHAFAKDKVEKIIVRLAKKEEHIETLDGKERELSEDMLVIASPSGPIAVAGVMGGKWSAVTDETTEIIIEAANFEAVSIRKTSGKLGLRTDASMRYEKSLDPNLTEIALARAYALIKTICKNAKASSSVSDVSNFSLNQGPVVLSLKWINDKIGQDIPEKQIISILEKLGFVVEKKDDKLSVIIPTWRAAKDVTIAEDILEEIVRVYGYDNIITSAPLTDLNPPEILAERLLEKEIKNFLALNLGLSETYNYSFVGESQLKKLNLDSSGYLKLVNPISDLGTMLRQSLLVGLLNNVKTNQFNYNEIRLFELGRVYLDAPGIYNKVGDDKERLPYQEKRLAFILSGKSGDYFREAKGIIEALIETIYNKTWEIEFVAVEDFPVYSDNKKSVRIRVANRDLGIITTINSEVKNNYSLKNETVFVELNFAELLILFGNCRILKYEAAPKYPAISRDLAFVVDGGMLYNDLRREIKSFNDLITEVELFDSYQGGKLGEDKKSLAFHVVYQSLERTLRTEEVDLIQSDLISRLEEKFHAQIRNF